MAKNNSNNKTKRICVVDTPFTLYYYLLLFGVNKEDIFIVSYNIPEYVRNNINHIYFPITRIYPYDNLIHIIKDLWLFIRLPFELLILRLKIYLKTRGCHIQAYGHAHLLFSFPLYENEDNGIIEDGIGNYAELPKFKEFSLIPRFILNKIFGKYIRTPADGFGTHPNIKKIYLTKNEGYSEYIKDKVIVNGLNDLINSMHSEEKNKILKIFNSDKIINSITENDILLLTEPFSESLELSIEEEIKIYEEMISKYNPKDIIIKPHPRENKNYEEFFPNIRIIKTQFPLELFNLMEINFKKILTIHSSAALNFDNVEIEFYEGKINNENVNKGRELIKNQYHKLNSKKNKI